MALRICASGRSVGMALEAWIRAQRTVRGTGPPGWFRDGTIAESPAKSVSVSGSPLRLASNSWLTIPGGRDHPEGESSRDREPLTIKAGAIVKRFLRAHAGSGESSVEIGSTGGFKFRETFPEKSGETSDEGIAGASRVNRLHLERRNMRHALLSSEQRTFSAQRDEHASDATGQELVRASHGVVYAAHGKAGNRLGFALVGHKVVEVCHFFEIDGLRGRRID